MADVSTSTLTVTLKKTAWSRFDTKLHGEYFVASRRVFGGLDYNVHIDITDTPFSALYYTRQVALLVKSLDLDEIRRVKRVVVLGNSFPGLMLHRLVLPSVPRLLRQKIVCQKLKSA